MADLRRATGCIKRTYLGGEELLNLLDFLDTVVQDREIGLEQAREICERYPEAVASNTDQHPRYYEEWLAFGREELKHQIEHFEKGANR